MWRLRKYLFMEVLGPTLMGLGVYTVLLLINLVFKLAEFAIRKQIPVLLLVKFVVLALPRIMVLTVPMAVLLGILIGMGRLSSDGEITALRASGVSYLQILPPMIVLGALGSVVAGFCALVLVPEATYTQHRMNAELLFAADPTRNIQPRVFHQQIRGVLLYADEFNRSGELEDLILVQQERGEAAQMTLASRARLEQDSGTGQLRIFLRDGENHSVDPESPERYQRSRYQEQVVVRPPDASFIDLIETLRGDLPRNLREMKTPDLVRALDLPPDSPDAIPERRRAQAEVEMHRRFAVPLAALIFAIFGPPLGIVTRRGGRSSGFAISLGVLIVYWLLMTSGENLARSDVIPTALAGWMPNGVLLAVGIGMTAWLAFDQRTPGFLRYLTARAPWGRRRSRTPSGAPRRGRRRRTLPVQVRPTLGFLGRLDRYVTGQFLRVMLFVMASFYVVYLLADLRTLLDEITENPNVTAALVARYFAYASPAMIQNGLSLAALLSTLLALGLLERQNEITAMKAAGISLFRISLPVVWIAILLSALQFTLTDTVVPHANQQASGEYQGISMYRFAPDRLALVERIEAATAHHDGTLWVLRDGWIRNFDGDDVSFEPFEETRMSLPEDPAYFRREVRTPAQMSFAELRTHTEELRLGGYDIQELRVALHEKVSSAAVPLILVLLGLGFSFRAGRHRGNLAGVGFAVIVAIVYYVFLAAFRQLGGVGILPPVLAAWSPDVIFGGVAIYRLMSLPT